MNTKKLSIDYVSMTMYRRSQYTTLQEALAKGAAHYAESNGYYSTMDTLYNMASLARMMDHRSDTDDVMVHIVINRTVHFPEASIADSIGALRRYANSE